MTVHDTINEETELAKNYAQDGAFRSAARVLRTLAETLIAHANWADGDPTIAIPAPLIGEAPDD